MIVEEITLNGNRSYDSPFHKFLRLIGFAGIGLAISEIVIGTLIFRFLTNFHVGAWYVGASILFICSLALLCEKSATLLLVGCVSLSGLIIALVGAIIDGTTWAMFDRLNGCYSPASNTYYGSRDYEYRATQCSPYGPNDLNGQGSCYCVQSSYCHHFVLADPLHYDCNDVLHLYPNWLHTSMIICSVLAIGCAFYMIFLCAGGCCNMCGWGSYSRVNNNNVTLIRGYNTSYDQRNRNSHGQQHHHYHHYHHSYQPIPSVGDPRGSSGFTEYQTLPTVYQSEVNMLQPQLQASYPVYPVIASEEPIYPYNPQYNPNYKDHL